MSRNSGLSTRLKPGLAAAALLASFAAQASPLTHLSDFKPVGSGTLRFFGLPIYDATLWSPGGAWAANRPFALELRYARSFSGSAIARRCIEEIRGLGTFPSATLAHWEQQMKALLPDVQAGDRLTGLRMPGKGVAFYRNARSLGQIDDDEFAKAFFDIWLNPATRAPELRARLLGAP
jgi:Chalcone isomerase-like